MYTVLRQVRLRADHVATGGTRHFRGGQLLPPPASLQIVQYRGDDGYYLLYLDDQGQEMTDTYHASLEQAMAQATWEFGVGPDEWEMVGG